MEDPDQRFATARDLADELDRFLKGKPIHSRPVGSLEKLWRFCKRKPALSSFAAAAVLLLLVVAIGSPITAWRIRKSELRLAENLYAADMKLVELSVAEGNWGRARSLLQSHVPSPGSKDLRGFEWGYFKELAKGDQLRTVPAHSNMASAIAFTLDGRTIATASFDGLIKFWEYPAVHLVSEISRPGEKFVTLSFRNDGQLLAATTEAGSAYVWQMNPRQLLTNFIGRWTYAVFARSGPNLALCGGRVWVMAKDLSEFGTARARRTYGPGLTLALGWNGRQMESLCSPVPLRMALLPSTLKPDRAPVSITPGHACSPLLVRQMGKSLLYRLWAL